MPTLNPLYIDSVQWSLLVFYVQSRGNDKTCETKTLPFFDVRSMLSKQEIVNDLFAGLFLKRGRDSKNHFFLMKSALNLKKCVKLERASPAQNTAKKH